MDNREIIKSYSKIYFMTAFLHIIYIMVYYFANCFLLIMLNVLSVMVYLVLGVWALFAKRLKKLFLICFFEIMIFTVCSSIWVGWEAGFMLYIMGIMPLLFYSTFVLGNAELNKAIKYLVAMLIIFFGTMAICFWGKFQVYHIDLLYERILYAMNSVSAFVILVGFLIVFVGRVSDEKHELEEEKQVIENSANYDPLTQLLNRRLLDHYMSLSYKNAEKGDYHFSVLMCDIDDFKHVNDTYGHDCGDQILKKVANSIKDTLREKDLVFRWGGEEILILIPEDKGIARNVAERCRRAVETSVVEYNGQEVRVTITIGGCAYKQGLNKEAIISKADDNLYYGKKHGKNRVVI